MRSPRLLNYTFSSAFHSFCHLFFSFFTSTLSHRLCSLPLSSAERQESHTKLWTWKARQKNNNKDNRSLHVSKCGFLQACMLFTRKGIFPLTCAYMHIQDVIWMCLSVFVGVWAFMLCPCIYLCITACLRACRYESFHVCLCRKHFSVFTNTPLPLYLHIVWQLSWVFRSLKLWLCSHESLSKKCFSHVPQKFMSRSSK